MGRYETKTSANHPSIVEKAVEILTLGVAKASTTYNSTVSDRQTGKSGSGFGYSKSSSESKAFSNLKSKK